MGFLDSMFGKGKGGSGAGEALGGLVGSQVMGGKYADQFGMAGGMLGSGFDDSPYKQPNPYQMFGYPGQMETRVNPAYEWAGYQAGGNPVQGMGGAGGGGQLTDLFQKYLNFGAGGGGIPGLGGGGGMPGLGGGGGGGGGDIPFLNPSDVNPSWINVPAPAPTGGAGGIGAAGGGMGGMNPLAMFGNMGGGGGGATAGEDGEVDWGRIIGMALGAGAGFIVGGTPGAMMGANLGGQVGGSF